MEPQTAQSLSEQTTAFYRAVSTSFSSTRQTPWQGWNRVIGECVARQIMEARDSRPRGSGPRDVLNVLDLACGNLRFERFLTEKTSGTVGSLRVWAVDNCDELVDAGRDLSPNDEPSPGHTPFSAHPPIELSYQHLDLATYPERVDAPLCHLSVCFGFMHHLPTAEQRLRVLEALVAHTARGGIIATSFWQFEKDPRILAKAQPLDARGDYLLGWQGRTDVARYCHSFSEGEIDELIAQLAPGVREVARFSADGKTGNLNRYLVLERLA